MNIFHKISSFLLPIPPILGLSFSDHEIVLSGIDRSSSKVKNSKRLGIPPTLIQGGLIKNSELLGEAILELKKMNGFKPTSRVRVVLSLSPQISFSTNLPMPPGSLSLGDTEGSLKLSADLESPIKLRDGYYDWQYVGFDLKTSRDIYVFSIALQNVINEYLSVCNRVGLEVFAVETWGLSLGRLALRHGYLGKDNDYLLVYRTATNALLLVVISRRRFFTELFIQLDLTQPVELTDRTLDVIARFIEYHHSETGREFEEIIIFVPDTQLLERIFQRFRIKAISLFNEIGNNFNVISYGTALRGIDEESLYQEISLAPAAVKQLYKSEKEKYFFSIWAETALTFFVFLALIFTFAFIVMNLILAPLENPKNLDARQSARLAELISKAAEFNAEVAQITAIEKNLYQPRVLLAYLTALIVDPLQLKNLSLSEGGNFTMQLTAPSRMQAQSFRDKLTQNNRLSNINLPYESIVEANSTVTFTITGILSP